MHNRVILYAENCNTILTAAVCERETVLINSQLSKNTRFMARFTYTVRDENDQVLTGLMSGMDSEEVSDHLFRKNYDVISLEEVNFDGSKKGESFFDKFKTTSPW